MKVFFVVVVVLTIISLTEGGKKEKPDKEARKAAKAEKKCNKFIKKYEGCLKKGFKSTLGCGTGDDGEDEDDNADIGCWDKADREKKGVGYLGSQSTTRGGHTCQKWTAQSPQEHGYTLSDYPDKGLGDHNYCRNPGEKYTDVWCYTTTTDKRWDWCDVPTCSAAAVGWSKHDGKYLGGYSAGVAKYDTLEQAQAECVKRTDCGGITYETSGSKKYTLRKGADLRDSPSAEISYKLLPKLSGAWTQIPGGLTRISKGKSGVWGVNSADSIYKLNADGKSWTKIAGGLVQVASGAAVWGVNKADSIYKYLGDNKWQNMPGRLTNVDVSDNGNVWGVNRVQNIYRWLGSSWQNIAGKAIQVSVGNSGVWVVNAGNNIYYRVDTRGDPNAAGSRWVNVPGKLKWIASGKDIVVGVNALNDIYYRDGISDAAPTGTKWVKINGKLSQIDVFDDEVVGTNPGSNIYRSPYGAGPKPKPATKPAPKPAAEEPAEEMSKKDLKKCGKVEKKLKKCDYEC